MIENGEGDDPGREALSNPQDEPVRITPAPGQARHYSPSSRSSRVHCQSSAARIRKASLVNFTVAPGQPHASDPIGLPGDHGLPERRRMDGSLQRISAKGYGKIHFFRGKELCSLLLIAHEQGLLVHAPRRHSEDIVSGAVDVAGQGAQDEQTPRRRMP